MLPEEAKKEQISQFLIYWMTAVAGIKVSEDNLDHGVDFTLKEVKRFIYKEKVRFMNSGKAVDVQLKCTTEKSITTKDGKVLFDLPVKNYNDMVLRRQEREVLPLILIVVILPEKPDLWYESSFERLTIQAKRLWFMPPMGAKPSANKQKVRVKIPTENQVSPQFFESIFQKIVIE